MPLFGIEVSKYNGALNFAAIKDAGVRFALIAASDGKNKDSRFEANAEGFSKVKVPTCTYHILTADTVEGVYREADVFLDAISAHRAHIPLGTVCRTVSAESKSLCLARAFMKRVEAEGLEVMLSISKDTYASYMPDTDALAIRPYTERGQLIGVVGEYTCSFAYAPVSRRIIKLRTDITDDTLDYIERHERGEYILARLADMIVARTINPLRNPSYEHIASLLRLCCKLSADECAHLCAYRWSDELLYELYRAMVK